MSWEAVTAFLGALALVLEWCLSWRARDDLVERVAVLETKVTALDQQR